MKTENASRQLKSRIGHSQERKIPFHDIDLLTYLKFKIVIQERQCQCIITRMMSAKVEKT